MQTTTPQGSKKTVEKDLVDLENAYWQAMKDKDVDGAVALTDFPCLVAGATGVARVERDAFVKMMTGARYTLHSFELKKSEVRFLNESLAIVAYEIHEDMTVEGQAVSLDASDASVWIRRGEKWLCALHTESLKGDPYGRDKSAPEPHPPAKGLI